MNFGSKTELHNLRDIRAAGSYLGQPGRMQWAVSASTLPVMVPRGGRHRLRQDSQCSNGVHANSRTSTIGSGALRGILQVRDGQTRFRQVLLHFCISTFGKALDDGLYVIGAKAQFELV
jgi:hypothetical protein